MINKDEFSMTKPALNTSNSQPNILALGLTNNNSRNNITNNINKKRENQFKSLPKLKGSQVYNEKLNNYSIYNNNNNSSTLLNYCERKKHLSFYKGSNISLSSFFLDTNKTISTDMKSTYGFTKVNLRKNKKYPNFRHKIIDDKEENIDKKEKINFREKNDKIKSTLNPYLDISKLTYKTTITSIRNKYSILFNKEFELFDKFMPSLYTLKFDHETKFYLNQIHNKILSCIKYLSGVFLDQDVETFKINEPILETILTNLLELFMYNNKVNNSLIRHTKKIMVDMNRDKQEKKVIVDVDKDTKIKNLKKKLENKNETIKQIKNEKFQEHNDYMINIKKLRDEQNDLVRLLKKNMDYFNMYQDCQKEIKEKNNIITQQKIDYKEMLDKNLFDKVKLEENLNDLKEFINPMQDENELIKNKNKDLEDKLGLVDEIMKKKNQIIYRLQENLMMKEEELMHYISENDKIKEKNDKLSYDLINLRKRFQNLNYNKYGFSSFDYENNK